MYNNIIELLKLEDYNLIINIKEITDKNVLIEVEHPLVEHFCPNYRFKMHSKGIRIRKVKHPIYKINNWLLCSLKKGLGTVLIPNVSILFPIHLIL